MFGLDLLRRDDHIHLAVFADAGVVEVGDEVDAILAERQLGIVEVNQVRIIGVDEVLTAEEPVLREAGIHGRYAFVPGAVVGLVPLVGLGYGGEAIRHHDIAAGVELLGIEAVPPLAFAV